MKKFPFFFAYVVGLILFLGMPCEVFLRLYLPEEQGYYAWQLGLHLKFIANPVVTPGVNGAGRFTTNSFGLRSDETLAAAENIFVFGDSSTADLQLDQTEMWTYVLARQFSVADRLRMERPS